MPIMKAIVNRKHFVTNALVKHNGKIKKCRLSIDLDKTSDGHFLITEMAIHKVIKQKEFTDYNLALDYYATRIQRWL